MFQTDPFSLIVLFVGLSLLPFVAMIATSYLKIVVVMSLIRNALGIQSIPPNMVINALAMILTFYIMAPVASESWGIAQKELGKQAASASGASQAAKPAAGSALHKHRSDRQGGGTVPQVPVGPHIGTGAGVLRQHGRDPLGQEWGAGGRRSRELLHSASVVLRL